MVQSISVCKQTPVLRVQEIIQALCCGSGPFYFGRMFSSTNSWLFIHGLLITSPICSFICMWHDSNRACWRWMYMAVLSFVDVFLWLCHSGWLLQRQGGEHVLWAGAGHYGAGSLTRVQASETHSIRGPVSFSILFWHKHPILAVRFASTLL